MKLILTLVAWLAATPLSAQPRALPLPPAAAASTLARLDSPANLTGISLLRAVGPIIVVIDTTQHQAPSLPSVRLDGTSLSEPSAIYGAPPAYYYYLGYYNHGTAITSTPERTMSSSHARHHRK